MKTEVFINPKFSNLSDIIKRIPHDFYIIGDEIFNGRNELRIVSKGEQMFVVKYFRRITLANRLIYATFRKSKSQRSYENAIYLLNNGIGTPEPIAYINFYNYGLLYKCYYICLFSNYKPLSEILKYSIPESEEVLKAFAKFTFNIHRKGIAHNDYTVNNILYSINNKNYNFSLIDNNRMTFRKYSYKRGLKDLERLKLPVDKMGIVAAEYAKQAEIDDVITLYSILSSRVKYIFKKRLKLWFKSMIPF